jgi:LuxR family maltose regulon positive regulatory protein
MSASGRQPRARRGERRIIERPRLLKLLDETEARTILLVAPAGYGKTILLRQWVKTLSGAVCLTLTRAHRDVATLADDLAAALSPGEEETRFVREYVRARGNPQKAARAVGKVLAQLVTKHRPQWIVLDDYHELGDAAEATEVIEELLDVPATRFLVAGRTRPAWATSRRIVYGDLTEIARDSLAMNAEESKRLLGRRPDVEDLIRQSEGWPAVLGLASTARAFHAPGEALPAALYDYFAEELFRAAPESIRGRLSELALASDLSYDSLEARFGDRARQVVDEARELGFMSLGKALELHPLLREFLLQKLAETANFEAAVRAAIADAVAHESWDTAFELILRFRIHDQVEAVLEAGYRPLVRTGRLGTLSSFSSAIRAAPTFPPPIVDLVEAEVAHRDGDFSLASEISERVIDRLPETHALRSRAHAIIGQSAWIRGNPEVAHLAFENAHRAAVDDSDYAEALYGWALNSLHSELGDATPLISVLAGRRHRSPLDRLRYSIVEMAQQHFHGGFAAGVRTAEGLHVLNQVADPRTRSSFLATGAYFVGLTGNYSYGAELIDLALKEIDTFDLDFARPHAWWTHGFIELGLRRFGACERSLQRVEDSTSDKPVGYHILNARTLRARLALQTGQLDLARELVGLQETEVAMPSIHAEYYGTRALIFAATGELTRALEEATHSERVSTAVETRVLAAAARGVVSALSGDQLGVIQLWELAQSLGTWDPLIFACRSSPTLAASLLQLDAARPRLAGLYQASNDRALARQSGLRTRSSRPPSQVLSPRELEVLELLARGFKNRDVAKALVISQSTTKVHVRHILEKLGVRSRTEAVARFTSEN